MSILSSVLLMMAALSVQVVILSLISDLPEPFVEALAYVWGLVQGLDAVFPIATLIAVIGLILQIELIILQLRFVRWLWIRLRGSGA